MKNVINKIKDFYLSFESKVSKRAVIITSAALFVGLVVAISVAAANAGAATKYNAIVDALNNNLWTESSTQTDDNTVMQENADNVNEETNIENDAGDSGKETTVQPPAAVSLLDDQAVVIEDKCEFYIDFSNITKTVYPPSPASYYTYYESSDGKVYVDICVAYKNLTTSEVGADDVVSAKLKYDEKYEYTGFSCIEEDSRGDFTYSNITSIAPLSTEYIHYLFEVPEVVSEGSESIVINIRIGGNDYTYSVR